MKFLSVFTKAPKHQRFNYTPRFYDPQKEEMQERERRIRAEIAKEKGENHPEDLMAHRTRISAAFQTVRKRSKPDSGLGDNTAMLRLGILLFIVLFIIAFLEFGRPAFYSLILFVPFYLYLKFKRK